MEDFDRFNYHDFLKNDSIHCITTGRTKTGKSYTTSLILWFLVANRYIKTKNIYFLKPFYNSKDYQGFHNENKLLLKGGDGKSEKVKDESILKLKAILDKRFEYIKNHDPMNLQRMCIVFDDVSGNARYLRIIEELMETSRHVRCSIFINIHHINKLDPSARSQASYYIITSIFGKAMIQALMDMCGSGENYKNYAKFLESNAYSNHTQKIYRHLIYDVEGMKYSLI